MAEDSFPYIRFEVAAVEDRAASIEKGYYVTKDVHYAYVTRPGQRDTLVKDAIQYAADLREAARQNRIPPTWPASYDRLYSAWKDGIDAPLDGTPILGWTVIAPAAQKMLIQAGIRTVEDLASIPEADMASIGMGAIGYRQKAVAWLETASNIGKAAEKMAAMEIQMAEAARIMKEQAEAIKSLQAKIPQPPAASPQVPKQV